MKRILVGTDLSAASAVALDRACRIAADARGEVRIVLVAPPPASEGARTEAEEALAHFLETALPAVPPPFSTGVTFGSAPDGLVADAAEFTPDLIAVGAHGEPHLQEALFGSTVTRLLWKAPCPILIVQTDPARPYRKLLAAIDEASASRLLCLACAIPSIRDLCVTHAYGENTQAALGYGDVMETMRSGQQAVIDQAMEDLARTREGRTPVTLSAYVEEGDPATVVAHAWQKMKPDLAVLGSHGSGGVSWLINNSIAEATLLSYPGDVLIMPPA